MVFPFGLLAFEICPVDHHPDDAVLKGENYGFGGSRGDRASVTGGDQSIVAPADDQVVLVVELENSNSEGLCFFISEGHGFSLQLVFDCSQAGFGVVNAHLDVIDSLPISLRESLISCLSQCIKMLKEVEAFCFGVLHYQSFCSWL
jgi:hypothetical protein